MPLRGEKSPLKRARGTLPEGETESKKHRPSDHLSKVPGADSQHLPSPITHLTTEDLACPSKDPTPTPTPKTAAEHRHVVTPRKAEDPREISQALSSPSQDTQSLSQSVDSQTAAVADEEDDEIQEGVWGYLVPLDPEYGDKPLVLKKRNACSLPGSTEMNTDKKAVDRKNKSATSRDEAYERTKIGGSPSGGYLIGRHPECDIVVSDHIVSNRHCLLFAEKSDTDTVAILEDLSQNGTFVNEAFVGRNQRRELDHGDEIAVHGKARFVFRYPHNRQTNTFLQQYTLLQKLGKGHFAEVYLCFKKSSGQRYAVKIFTKHAGMEERSKTEGLQQEIGVLMSVSHPNVVCLKDAFNQGNRVYLVLELAPEGELLNYIVMKQRLNEDETRKLFTQLFQGIRYLHERNIVHRDIKPENILFADKNLHVKLADFGLAKIIGEESFTTTLCGTPSYVAPEILADSKQRKYTKAVDVWSLGVVLYICLCGFPPFSDELYSRDFPYTLSQQIRSGRFDYPSPYWDSVSDPALDLIDSMLVVDPDRRFTIDQCLSHPWLNHSNTNVNDRIGGLVGGFTGLEVSMRGPLREQTLLSNLDSVTAAATVDGNQSLVKVFSNRKHRIANTPNEEGTAHRLDDKNLLSEKKAPLNKFNGNKGAVSSMSPEQELVAPAGISRTEKDLEQIDEDFRLDLALEKDRLGQLSYSCTPAPSVSTDRVPLTISGLPVVIPVEPHYPLRAHLIPPPDPHPTFIDPGLPLLDQDFIDNIFDLYDEALGVYLLIGGRLQVIVPDDFDYHHALSHKPRQFGGLEVSYIVQSLTPCARLVTGGSQQQTTEEESVETREPTQTVEQGAGMTVSPPTSIPAANSSDAVFKMTVDSTVQVVVKGSRSKDRFESCVGVMTQCEGKQYVTIPTHVVTSALLAAKSPAFPGDSWIKEATLFSRNGTKELGAIAETFDPNSGQFPTGFSHDVSLVDVSHARDLVSGIKAPIPTSWLSQSDWQGVKYRTTNLCLLNHLNLSARKASVKSIGLLDSQCQAVGQGIFLLQQPRKGFSFSRLRKAREKEEGPDAWTGLVARSLLFRVHPEFRPNSVQSGSAVCVLEDLYDGKKGAQVAGFTAFAQETTAIQSFDIEGPSLYSRLEQGRVAFYGAFQVPAKLRDEHIIL